ncbi:MAG: endonuclease MutS2 [Lachnospiraceae bacterium]|nr:endonuclease MutS2 [Lachnospiraceae bacterium]
MNDRAIRVLEFDKIREMLIHYAGSTLGRIRAGELMPVTTLEEADLLQMQAEDATKRIDKKGSLSFGGIGDIGESLVRLQHGGCLTAPELLRIGAILTATQRVKQYGTTGTRGEDAPQDTLTERFELLETMPDLCREINRCILSEEEIADDASAGLRSVRRKIKAANDKIHERMASILAQASQQGLLQDTLITQRDGRYCLPYKSEYKNQVAGMIHDQSATGSTSFIEPMEVVKLNNELRELAIAEQEEIQKVLAALSEMIAPRVEELRYNGQCLAELDLIFARAMFGRAIRGNRPTFTDNRTIRIIQGRHPLIPDKKVVPIDIALGEDPSMIVITGPNTGGKTVTLKTVGLFTMMAQAGLPVPAKSGTEMGIFREVYADIGDEQSIEQSLSTFSSHMTNTVHILEEADEESLVLCDELGAGTDPTEGAALATSILLHLHRFDIRTIATTHYAELKMFALRTPGVMNACCEFDVESLRPTYRLLMGIPGKSNAFAISKKLGLSDTIIDEAEKQIGESDRNFEDIITDLENKRRAMEAELLTAREDRRKAEQMRAEWERKTGEIEAKRDEILRKAREEARDTLEEAKTYADESIKRVRKLESRVSSADLENERRRTREKLSELEEKLPQMKPAARPAKQHKASDFRIGDSVMVLSMNLKGTIHSLPNEKGDCFVTMGIMTSKVNISDLAKLEEETPKKDNSGVKVATGAKSLTIRPEINLVGLRVDEALAELDKYLDDAYLAHLAKVTVIHGRGTGALRTAVHNHCKKLKYVKGVTISPDYGSSEVEFK